MFGCDKKSRVASNIFLVKSGYYDMFVFYNFLAIARQKNNKLMVYWAMISAGSNYEQGWDIL